MRNFQPQRPCALSANRASLLFGCEEKKKTFSSATILFRMTVLRHHRHLKRLTGFLLSPANKSGPCRKVKYKIGSSVEKLIAEVMPGERECLNGCALKRSITSKILLYRSEMRLGASSRPSTLHTPTSPPTMRSQSHRSPLHNRILNRPPNPLGY